MKEKDSHIIQLIKRYFKGEASRIDLRALEQAAADDEYILDAKEGIDLMSKVNRKTSLSNLESRIAKRVNKDDITADLPWMKLAAGLAILIAAGFFILRPSGNDNQMTADNIEQKTSKPENTGKGMPSEQIASADHANKTASSISVEKESNPFAISESAAPIDDIATKKSSDIAPTPTVETESAAVSNTSDLVNSATKDIASNDAKEVVNSSTQPDLASSTPGTEPNIEEEAELIAMDVQSEQPNLENAARMENRKAKSQTQELNEDLSGQIASASVNTDNTTKRNIASRIVRGKILDDKGQALNGAVVNDGTPNNSAITTADGTFELTIPTDTKDIEISYTGFKTKSQKIRSADTYEIYLEEDSSLSEVVVIGYGQNGNSSYAASPINGFDAYKTYIAENLQYPTLAKEANIKGKVVLLFNVTPSGRPRDIEVRKSLGYGCDKEAIRLLRQGANWKPGTQSGKNRIAIKFK